MLPSMLGGHPFGAERYGPPMNTNSLRLRVPVAAGAALLFAVSAAACGPAATQLPIGSPALPSINASAVASAAADAAVAALVQVDAAIDANQTSAGLTADEASSLKQLTAAARTALQTGDTTAAKTAVDNLSTKVDGFAAKLNNATGQQLTAAIAALKAALPAS
jgi:hypothetical protein